MNKKLLPFVVLLVCLLFGFGVYKWNDLRTWQLTQHPDDSGAQGMFYSLYNSNGIYLFLKPYFPCVYTDSFNTKQTFC